MWVTLMLCRDKRHQPILDDYVADPPCPVFFHRAPNISVARLGIHPKLHQYQQQLLESPQPFLICHGGLGHDLWAGTLALVRELLPQLPS